MQLLYVFLWLKIFTISHAKQNVLSLECTWRENNVIRLAVVVVLSSCTFTKIHLKYIFYKTLACREAAGHALMLPGLQAGCLDELALMWKTQGSLLLFFFFECSGYDKYCLAYLEEWLKLSHHGTVIKLIYWRPWTADIPWSIYSVPREEQLPTF